MPRFMIQVRATAMSEAGEFPDDPTLVPRMMAFHDEMAKAGVLLDGAGLQPSSQGFRVRYTAQGEPAVIDGPFANFAGIGRVRGLVLAGAAAGVAAAFNTPLAGVVFAIEEMAKEFEHRISGPVVGAVVLAGITGLALVGDYRYFGQTPAQLGTAQDWLAVPLCGLVGGLLGGAFSLGVLTMATRRDGLIGSIKSWPVCFAVACGPGVERIADEAAALWPEVRTAIGSEAALPTLERTGSSNNT